MNLQPVDVSKHGFTCECLGCGRVLGRMGREHEPRFADLDGEPFRAYYCETCAKPSFEVLATGLQRGQIKTTGSRFSDENEACAYANRLRLRGLRVRVEEQYGFRVGRVVSDR